MTAKLLQLTVLALATFIAAPAFAGGQATIDANQAAQNQRIEDARVTGELTRSEYRSLKAEQARISEMERKALADGRLSKREYKEIHEAQINASKHIKAESTDAQVSLFRRWLYRHPG
jgi:methionine-rich copper-binding protein CopC